MSQSAASEHWLRAGELATSGDRSGAATAVKAAWELSDTDFDRSVSAYYGATYASDDADRLHWALRSADSAQLADDRIRPHRPAIYATVAGAWLTTGDVEHARESYFAAADSIDETTPFVDVIWASIASGLMQTGFVADGLSRELLRLVDELVYRGSLGALSVVLPAVVRCTGTDVSIAELAEALDVAFWTPGLVAHDLRPLLVLSMASTRAQLDESGVRTGTGVMGVDSATGDSVGVKAREGGELAAGQAGPDVLFRL